MGVKFVSYYKKINYIFIKYFLFILIFFFIFPYRILADSGVPVSVSFLLKNAHEMNGKEITFSGEAIGQIIGKGEYKWINVLDSEGNAIGIWASENEIKKIKYLGKYNVKGDSLLIKGIFNKTCIHHDGESDIHSVSIQIDKIGFIENEKSIPKHKIILLSILFLITIFLLFLSRIIKKRVLNDYEDNRGI